MTVRDTVVLCCVEPLVPVIVMVYVPVGVPLVVLAVIWEMPEPPLICAGLKETVGPFDLDGDTLPVNATALVKPPEGVTVTV